MAKNPPEFSAEDAGRIRSVTEFTPEVKVPAAVAEVRRSKALAHVLEHARIVDTDGNVVDLGELDTADLPFADDDHEGHDHDHDRDRGAAHRLRQPGVLGQHHGPRVRRQQR